MANTGTNRLRNMELFVSSENLANVAITAINPKNTWQIQVLATPSLTQTADVQSISSQETGETPDRSEESFNTAVNPAEFEFQTYIRPTGATVAAAPGGSGAGTNHLGAVMPVADWMFWQQLVSNTVPLVTTGPQSVFVSGGNLLSNTTAAGTGVNAQVHASRTNFNEPTGLFLYWKVDGVYYKVSDASINQMVIGSDINELATTTWSGLGNDKTQLTGAELDKFVAIFGGTNSSGNVQLAANTSAANSAAEATVHPWAQMNVASTISNASFVTTKFSTARLTYKASQSASVENYDVGFTAFNLTYNNNIEPLTPAELNKLNKPVGKFVGARQVTGNMTMLLKNSSAGARRSAEFLRKVEEDQRTTIADTSTLNVVLGGANRSNVSFNCPATFYEFPNLEIDETIRVGVNFRAQQTAANKANSVGGEISSTFVKA